MRGEGPDGTQKADLGWELGAGSNGDLPDPRPTGRFPGSAVHYSAVWGWWWVQREKLDSETMEALHLSL